MNGNHRSLVLSYKYNAKHNLLGRALAEIANLLDLLQRFLAHGGIVGGLDVVFSQQQVVFLLISGIIDQDRVSQCELNLATPESIVVYTTGQLGSRSPRCRRSEKISGTGKHHQTRS